MNRSAIKRFFAVILTLTLTCGSIVSCASKKDPSDYKVRSKDPDKEPKATKVVPPEPTETEPGVTEEPPTPEPTSVEREDIITVYTYTQELADLCNYYKITHPDFEYSFDFIQIATSSGYEEELERALKESDEYTPDIYLVESGFAMKYTQNDMSEYAASYSDLLGYDVYPVIEEAEIAPYTYHVGMRPSDGEIVALCYQSDAGVMIYRSSIALDVFGTDDPDEISELVGGGSYSWGKFWECADKVSEKGYVMLSSPNDILRPMLTQTSCWYFEGAFHYQPDKMEYLDTAKMIADNGYSNLTTAWTSDWFKDFNGKGEKEVFAFFGPAWLVNYSVDANSTDTYGDWRVTDSPEPFTWGGSWVMASKKALDSSDEKRQAIADIIEWITLDTSETGAQYLWASGVFTLDSRDAVPSNVVLRQLQSDTPVLGGQDMFPYIIKSNEESYGKIISEYDDELISILIEAGYYYATGEITKEEAIERFKQDALDLYGIDFGS